MTPPMYVVVVALEEPVQMYADAGTEGQLARLDKWVHDHPELDELLTLACGLSGMQEPAA